MRVSLLNLNLVGRDAIGRCIIAQARFFQRRGDTVLIWIEQPPEDVPPDISALCRAVNPSELRRDHGNLFAASDLYIYHYGGRHGLMDSITTITGGVVCFYYHNVTPPELWNVEEERPLLQRGIEGIMLAAEADFVIADSEYNLRQLASLTGLSRERLYSVHLPVDVSAFHPGPRPQELAERYSLDGAPILLYVGRMAPNKRIDLLVDILNSVRHHPHHPQPDARLLLVGDQDSAPAYRLVTSHARAHANQLGIGGAVTFTGRVDPTNYYRLGSVYVTTSQHEGFCLPVIEAMASGVPVVATAGAALPDTVGSAGILVPSPEGEIVTAGGSTWGGEPNVAAMAGAVVEILENPIRARELRDRGLRHAATFTLERYEEAFAAIIDRECTDLPLRVQPAPHAQLAEEGGQAVAGGPASRSMRRVRAANGGNTAPSWPELTADAAITMPDYTVRSKAPLVGGLIAWFRRNATSHLKEPYVDPIFQSQQRFNERAAWIIEELTRRLEVAHRDQADTHHRLEQLDQAVRRLESTVARMEARSTQVISPANSQPGDELAAQPQAAFGINYLRCNQAVGGSMVDEMALYAPFVPLYQGASGPVLDLGCGQGAFLHVLEQAGISGYGVDVDPGMVQVCRDAGLSAEELDVFDALHRVEDASLGGIFSGHVIEHLPRARLSEFAALCWQKLEPGGALVWITPHGGALTPLHATFYKDITHTRPLHPDLLRFVLTANGFRDVTAQSLSDLPESLKLSLLPEEGGDDRITLLNRNLARLNEVVFGHVDCAMTGRR